MGMPWHIKMQHKLFILGTTDYCSCCMTYHLELNYMFTSICLFSDWQSFRRCLYCVYFSIISYESNVSYLRHLHDIYCPDPTEIFTSTVCLLFICCFFIMIFRVQQAHKDIGYKEWFVLPRISKYWRCLIAISRASEPLKDVHGSPVRALVRIYHLMRWKRFQI